ncbi:F0F1 ATP synthase subunit B' [Rhodobacter capsulatus]|uniref:F0F1 ATP synthase subunit B' n=1 Tax=Rhodobacter capsulatus TaxID=1061 RepID=UPI0003D3986C|nr:F0F1 ATP synthase subunit B' [Rhodobacter capsulatus]ETD82453.1 F0F1 ATP synthase subunit B' [Rhodobacter capsulatus YW1]ETD82916.1 F0F1 ATP synthase subunit B' [Rhodobacter capsulatus B6]ETD89579.1 F0F1 ATP synthase subunit B' [Rhodobacter capsulatus YW2]
MANETNAVEAAAAVAGHAAEAAEKGGMPQLDFSTFPNQIFWLLLALGAIYWLLKNIAIPRIASILADRAGTISGDLAAAEQYKLKAKDAEAAYAKALADARAQAQKIIAETRAVIQKDLDAATAKADADIAARVAQSEVKIAEIRAGALEAVQIVATDTATAIVTALGGKADMGALNAAVGQRVKG